MEKQPALGRTGVDVLLRRKAPGFGRNPTPKKRLEIASPNGETKTGVKARFQCLSGPRHVALGTFEQENPKTRIANGRQQVVRGFRVERSDWEVLIRDHHEGYIGWDAFERNQRLINDNANGKSWASRGAVRRGEALLAGLFRCGHCGRKLHVA